MVAICNTFVFLVLVPQAVGQGFLRSRNASQDASKKPQAASNSVSQDDISDSELRSDLQSEAIALQKDVNGEAGDVGDDEAAVEYEQKFSKADVDQLEDQVDELQGALDQRDAETQSRLAEEPQGAEEDGSSGAALVQSGVDDAPPSSDEDDEDAQPARLDPDNADADTGDVDHNALLLQDVTRLQDHLSQRHNDRSKDNEMLVQMMSHLLNEAAAAKQDEAHADPEVITVLLQILKKHTNIFGKQASKRRIQHGAAVTDELGYELSHKGDDEGMDETDEESEDDSAEDGSSDEGTDDAEESPQDTSLMQKDDNEEDDVEEDNGAFDDASDDMDSDEDESGTDEDNDEDSNEEADASEDGDEADAVDDQSNDGNADPDSFGDDEVSAFDTGEDYGGADKDESQALDFDAGQE